MAKLNINTVTIAGRLSADPVVKDHNGNLYLLINVATNEEWYDKNSKEKKSHVDWHKICIFGNKVNYIAKYAQKGSLVYLQGKLKTNSWDDNGTTRYSINIVVDNSGGFEIIDKFKSYDTIEKQEEEPQIITKYKNAMKKLGIANSGKDEYQQTMI